MSAFENLNVMRNEKLLGFSHTGDAGNFSRYTKRKFKGNIYAIINLLKIPPTKAGYELKLRCFFFLLASNTGQNNKAAELTHWRTDMTHFL